ncbi:hypothetical protein MOE20_19500 [Bacillus atrophaeus]|uniref:hypothetical protein n=1 Tax=Bacillus atrophaeus TaxID=1452 RepID=UPI00227E7F8B|nr:hypothetical protein [Bacillus atrophaeus]MCY8918567.1 hypothetical protein [Bacillus atrophaeus]MCY8926745.1 hypothetical protein [Bacillus atrophaeus]
MELPLDTIKKVRFKRRRVPISPELRPAYRISRIILILNYSCHNKKSSLLKLQLFNWGLQNENRYEVLLKLREKNKFPIIRFDPFLNKALCYGVAANLFDYNRNTGKFSLTTFGEEMAEKVIQEDVLNNEKEILKKINKKLSDDYIKKLFQRGNLNE